MLLTGCGPVLNPYNEDFKCRARDDAGECIDTPTAYKKARYPETATEEESEPAQMVLKQEVQDNRYKVLAGITAGREKAAAAATKNSPGAPAPLQR